MDKPKDTIRFLDNFDVALSLDNRADHGRQVTSVDISIQPLVFRVSFHDILLINSIINRAIEMSNRATVTPSVPSPNPAVLPNPTKSSLARKPSQSGSTNRGTSQRRLSVGAQSLKAQVIMAKETVRIFAPYDPS